MKIGGGWSHPHGRSGVVKPPPGPRGWSGHPQKAHKKKKKKRKMGFGFLGVAEPPPRALGWLRPPSKVQNLFFFFCFFFFLAFWGSWTISLGVGVVKSPQTGRGGSSSHPLTKGVAPDFHLFFFIFYFHLFKNKKLMSKTTSFRVGWML
jgi:hypothetical protein